MALRKGEKRMTYEEAKQKLMPVGQEHLLQYFEELGEEEKKSLLKQIEDAGLRVAGRSGDDQLVEIIEVPNHPWFVACQFHPEFTSTPRDGHPLFAGFVKAASEHQKRQAK